MKKGFTLIEMLGIITVLAILLLVTFPNMNKSLKEMKDNKNKNIINNLKISAESYKELNNIKETTEITVQKLYDQELMKEKNNELDMSSKILITSDSRVAEAIKIGDKCYIKQYNSDDITIIDYNISTCKYATEP